MGHGKYLLPDRGDSRTLFEALQLQDCGLLKTTIAAVAKAAGANATVVLKAGTVNIGVRRYAGPAWNRRLVQPG